MPRVRRLRDLSAVQAFMPELGSSRTRRCSCPGSAAAAGSRTTWTRTACTASTGAPRPRHRDRGRGPGALGVGRHRGRRRPLDRREPPDPRAPSERRHQDPPLQQPDLRIDEGQYSPTSEEGKVTKSTPFGSVDHPFNPIALALGVEATFVARTVDNDRQHLTEVLRRAAQHKGTAFVEIYQNCNVFNDGAFDLLRDKAQGKHNQIRLEHGEPIVFDEGTDASVSARTAGTRSRPRPRQTRTAWSCTTPTAGHRSRSRWPTSRAARTNPRASVSSTRWSARCTGRRSSISSKPRRSASGRATSARSSTSGTPGRWSSGPRRRGLPGSRLSRWPAD